MPDLLIELFSEEIPARMQARAAADLQKLVTDGLVEAGLTYAGARAFATPRRLALAVDGLLAASPTLREERKGPKADAPEKAIEGFLRGAGLTRDQVEERDTPKGPVLFAIIEKPGRPAAEIITEVLERVIRTFPWPKSMRWGSGSLRWVRPLQSILCILSDEAGHEVVPMEVDGFVASDTTYGHRFMAPAQITVRNFEDYEAQLRRAYVVLDAEERAQAIWNDATNVAFASGLEVVEDKGLLAEVAGLVEWPVVLMGPIGAAFLDLPPEVLQTSMKEHQKFFSVRDKAGKITRFITVANRETADDGATILAGNEKVLAARLADAVFFWANDLRVAQAGMGEWMDALENVTIHGQLGSQADLIRRMTNLARELAPICGADPDAAEEAARLAKADLNSEMVYEFPELQGVIGRYYLEAAGKALEIAAASKDHYAPLGPADAVPTAPVSVAVALAEKLDKLSGFWVVHEKPTGSKDPFALRRAALGVIRLALENNLSLPLEAVLPTAITQNRGDLFVSTLARPFSFDFEDGELETLAASLRSKAGWEDFAAADKILRNFAGYSTYGSDPDADAEKVRSEIIAGNIDIVADLVGFFHDRLKVYLRDQGIRHDVISAAMAPEGADDLALLTRRARELQAVLDTPDGTNLVQGYKRANNLLSQAEAKDGVEYSYGADRKYADDPAELALFDALDTAEPTIEGALIQGDFAAALSAMAGLRAPIDAFFEAVKINADSEVVRRNRLNLLSRIRQTCDQVAFLGEIEG